MINGKVLEDLVLDRGLTFQQLAKKSGLSYLEVMHIRYGQRKRLFSSTMIRLAKALKIQPSKLKALLTEDDDGE